MPTDAPREYLLELWRGEILVEAYVLPNVNSYDRRPIPALDRQWTAAARPVKQSAGIREEEIRCTGVSGRNPTGIFIADTRGAALRESTGAIDGVAYFERLLAFVRTYEDDAGKYRSVFVQNVELAPTMVFRDLGMGLAWYVDDIHLDPSSRVGGSRNSYEYVFSCKTEGLAKAQTWQVIANTPTVGIPFAETRATALLAAVQAPASQAEAATQAAQDAETETLSLVQVLEEIPGNLAYYETPVRAFLAQAENFTNIAATAIRAGLGIPRDAARNFRTYCETTARIVYNLWDASTSNRDEAQVVRDNILAGVNALRASVTTLLGSAGSKLGPAGQPVTLGGGATRAGAQLCSVERLRQGEDLQAFALRVLGFAGRWIELADLNQMSSPWALNDGSPLTPGTPLLVPLPLSGNERTPDGDATNVYGTDLLWDFDAFDFVVEGDEPTDFLSVTGLSNLRQALLTRFTTAENGVLVRPNLGLPDTTGQVATPERAAIKASRIVTQAGADPRIALVKRVVFTETANIQRAEIDVTPIADEAFTVTLPA